MVAQELDLTESAVRAWVRQAEDRCGPRAGRAPDDRGAGGARPLAARGADAADGARHPKKSDGLLREGERVKFAFIAAEKASYPVRVLCRMLAVSRAASTRGRRGRRRARTQQDQRLGVEIQAIHAETRQRYGSPRVHAELRERGHRVGRKRVARLMRAARALRPPAAPVSDHDRLQSSPARGPQRAGAAVRRPRPRHGVGHRHYVSLDARRAGCTWPSSSISSRAPSWAGP